MKSENHDLSYLTSRSKATWSSKKAPCSKEHRDVIGIPRLPGTVVLSVETSLILLSLTWLKKLQFKQEPARVENPSLQTSKLACSTWCHHLLLFLGGSKGIGSTLYSHSHIGMNAVIKKCGHKTLTKFGVSSHDHASTGSWMPIYL